MEDYADPPSTSRIPWAISAGDGPRLPHAHAQLAGRRQTDWWIAPQTVGAVLVFQQNAYNFPAALLQVPKFDPAASDAANYGAIGAIVATRSVISSTCWARSGLGGAMPMVDGR